MPITQGADSLPTQTGITRLIGYSIIDHNNRRGYGLKPGLNANDLTSYIDLTATQQSLGLFCTDMPSAPNRLIRATFHFPAAGVPNSNIEWYFLGMVSINGGAFTYFQEVRYAPAGLNAPSPKGEMIFTTPAGTTTLGVGWDARVQAGYTSTPRLFRWDGGNALPQFRSFMTVEDLGVAA